VGFLLRALIWDPSSLLQQQEQAAAAAATVFVAIVFLTSKELRITKIYGQAGRHKTEMGTRADLG
jgi:hypothetical protein